VARGRKKDEGEQGAPKWMATFADLMSLLLTFFVLLLSFSTIAEPDKFEQAMISLRGAFGVMDGASEPVRIFETTPERSGSDEMRRIARELRRRLQVRGEEQNVDLQFDENGLRINLPSQVLFSSGSAVLQAQAAPILEEVAGVLSGVSGLRIQVVGHTDNIPLTSSDTYRDNYDLSYGRAKSVTRYLFDEGGIPLENMEMVARGPDDPIATNETEEGRQRNRRVELFVRAESSRDDLGGVQEQLDEIGTTAPQQQPQ